VKWVLVAFFAVMTFSLAVPRQRALLKAIAHETPRSSTVTFPSGEETISAYLAIPEGGRAPYPAVLLIHDRWGLDEGTRSHARRLSVGGDFVTLAVDLYRGKTATTPKQAQELMDGLPQRRALDDLASAVAYLKSLEKVDANRVGVIGWGMGADYALLMASQRNDLRAGVICYGTSISNGGDYRSMNTPLLGIFGGQDASIPVACVLQFERSLLKMGKKVEVMIYPLAGSEFMNPNNPTNYRDEDAQDAWSRIFGFLSLALAKR